MMSGNKAYDIPILMIVFNRPELTQKVLKKVLEVNPQRLYVVADGARDTHADDMLKVSETRKLFDSIPPHIQFQILLREENYGCKKSVTEGIDWFFEHEEMGIILEDDCIPNTSFFYFMRENLHQYKDVERVMHIGGANYQFGNLRGEKEADYFFSNIPHVWGWASWRRAWKKYDEDPIKLEQFLKTKKASDYGLQWFYFFKYKQYFQRATHPDNRNIWDYRWQFIMWYYGGIAITPNVNLVQNIGFGTDATHTFAEESKFANIPTVEMEFPLNHPQKIEVDYEADNYYLGVEMGKNWTERVIKKIKSFF